METKVASHQLGKMQKPKTNQIKLWLKDDVTRWLLETLAFRMNEIDTVRNLTENNYIENIANRKAIETIENLLSEVYQELPTLQQKVAEKEYNVTKVLIDFKDIDY
jgi:DNA recombination-dependent growth factor C